MVQCLFYYILLGSFAPQFSFKKSVLKFNSKIQFYNIKQRVYTRCFFDGLAALGTGGLIHFGSGALDMFLCDSLIVCGHDKRRYMHLASKFYITTGVVS
jgi:hypothetical protein